MMRLNKKQKFRPSSDAKAFLQYLKERAVFGRQIDAYAFAAAYAMKNNLIAFSSPVRYTQYLLNLL